MSTIPDGYQHPHPPRKHRPYTIPTVWQRMRDHPLVRTIAMQVGRYTRPRFLIIGAQKAGTTSLHEYLMAHPRFLPGYNKEIHFFDKDEHYMQGEWWYWAQFPVRGRGEPRFITGDATPYYLFHPHVPSRVRQMLPDARMIALLRNPVERAYSGWMHVTRGGEETLSFEDALEREFTMMRGEYPPLYAIRDPYVHQHYTYLSRGMYAEQLKRWFAQFPRERFLITTSDEFFAHPGDFTRRSLEFICAGTGIDPYDYPSFEDSAFRVFNEGNYSTSMRSDTRAMLVEFFKPHNRALEDLLKIDLSAWDR